VKSGRIHSGHRTHKVGDNIGRVFTDLSAMSMGSVIVLPSDLNDKGRDALFLRLFITSFGNFHVIFGLFYM